MDSNKSMTIRRMTKKEDEKKKEDSYNLQETGIGLKQRGEEL